MAISYFGPTSSSLVNWKASGALAIAYTRNPKNFAVANYCRLVPTAQENGVYKRLNFGFDRKLMNDANHQWPSGTYRPSNASKGLEQQYVSFITKRYNYDVPNVDDIVQASALLEDTDVIAAHTGGVMNYAMGMRTRRVLATATATANWLQSAYPEMLSADHTGTATAIGGGLMDVGTFAAPYINNAFLKVRQLINLDTNGSVDNNPDKFFCIMNPNTALALGKSPEIRQTVQNSYMAPTLFMGQTGELAGSFSPILYNLPQYLYGFRPLIEDATVDTNMTNSITPSYILTDGQILFLYRDGPTGAQGIQGDYTKFGAQAQVSTLCLFYCTAGYPGAASGIESKEAAAYDIKVQTEYSAWNRLTKIAADENVYPALTCPASGYLLTSCITGT